MPLKSINQSINVIKYIGLFDMPHKHIGSNDVLIPSPLYSNH